MSAPPGWPSDATTTEWSPAETRTSPTGRAAQQIWADVSSTAKTRRRSTGMAMTLDAAARDASAPAEGPPAGGPPLAAAAAEGQPGSGQLTVDQSGAAGASSRQHVSRIGPARAESRLRLHLRRACCSI